MTGTLTITSAGPAMSIQDLGRPGFRALGLTTGGAADRRALYEGAALLGQGAECAAIEMAGSGGTFVSDAQTRIALTGAPMRATLGGEALVWNASHAVPAGEPLTIGGAKKGSYGYLHIGGGVDVPRVMGARGSHLAGGIGQILKAGETLPLGMDQGRETGLTLPFDDRYDGGTIRIVASAQTGDFAAETIARFTSTTFTRDARANRMGVRMLSDGDGFATEGGLSIVSEVVVPGDIQIAGDGTPYVLMYECQTTGGYPRIGTVLPSDLPRIAQAQTGTAFRFEMLSLEDAIAVEVRARSAIKALRSNLRPLVRDPATIPDLLRYQLVSGAVSAQADPFE